MARGQATRPDLLGSGFGSTSPEGAGAVMKAAWRLPRSVNRAGRFRMVGAVTMVFNDPASIPARPPSGQIRPRQAEHSFTGNWREDLLSRLPDGAAHREPKVLAAGRLRSCEQCAQDTDVDWPTLSQEVSEEQCVILFGSASVRALANSAA